QRLIVNGVFRATDARDSLALALERRGVDALAHMPDVLAGLPRETKALRAENLVGIETLRAFIADVPERLAADAPAVSADDMPESVGALLDDVQAAGHGLIMVMGKGGVGKTTIAAAVAVELAGRGVPVHLSTTDPAAHVAEALGGAVEGLTVSRIDPRAETERYVQRVLQTKGKDLD